MPRMRRLRAGDEAALADVCIRTADAGGREVEPCIGSPVDGRRERSSRKAKIPRIPP